MQLDWGKIRGSAGECLKVARNAAGAALLSGLAVALVVQAAGSRRERETVARESAAMDREIARLRRANQALRDEIKALDSDPVYVEALLRRWKMVGPSERVVE